MNGIYWLASYPKSGNTWFRVFLSNLLQEKETPVNINQLNATPIASARNLFDDTTGLSAEDLTFEEIDNLRPRVYEQVAREVEEPVFLKIHDAYTYTSAGEPLVSTSATLGAIYFIRNPLDVAVSFAHHNASSEQKIIEKMGDESYAFCSKPHAIHRQLRQILKSWSGHVKSWVDAPNLRVYVMRYEDMLLHPIETFTGAVEFAGLPYSKAQIEKALAASSFSELKRQEVEQGFREKMPRSESFFRQGKIGTWRGVLTPEQIEKIIADHTEMMQRFGYISDTSGGVICLENLETSNPVIATT